jgi:hypothetical protein
MILITKENLTDKRLRPDNWTLFHKMKNLRNIIEKLKCKESQVY